MNFVLIISSLQSLQIVPNIGSQLFLGSSWKPKQQYRTWLSEALSSTTLNDWVPTKNLMASDSLEHWADKARACNTNNNL